MTNVHLQEKHKKNHGPVKKFWPYFFIAPFFIIYGLFNLYPILYTFFISLHQWSGLGVKKFIGLQNYAAVLKDQLFLKAIQNTLIIMAGYIPIMIICALLIALLINSRAVISKKFFQTAIFLPYVTASVAIGIIFSLLFSWSNGIINNILSMLHLIPEGVNWLGEPGNARLVVIMMLFWRNLGYTTVLFMAGLANIPQDYFEAAEIDGANFFQRLFYIIIPLLKQTLTFIMVIGITNGFQLYDDVYMLFNGIFALQKNIGGPNYSVLTAVWYIQDLAYGRTALFGYGSAVSYALFVCILICTGLFYFVINRKKEL